MNKEHQREEAGTGSMSGDSFAREQRMGSSKLQKSSGIQESGEIQESGGIASSRGMTDAPYSVKKNYGEDNAPQIQMGIQSRRSGGVKEDSSHPWKITITDAAAREFKMQIGAVNGSLPSNMFDTDLSLLNADYTYIFVKVTVDSTMTITANEIIIRADDDPTFSLDETGGVGFALLAIVEIANRGTSGESIKAPSYVTNQSLYHAAYLQHIFWT